MIGVPLIIVSLWLLANDPTVLTWRHRMRLASNGNAPLEYAPIEDIVAIFPHGETEVSQHHNRRRAEGRIKSSFRRKRSFQKQKTR
jgi:hypothetical protein